MTWAVHHHPSWISAVSHSPISKPLVWLIPAPLHLPVCELWHLRLADCGYHDTNGLQIQPARLLGGWLPKEATASAGGWHTHEPVRSPGGETGCTEEVEHSGVLPQDSVLQLPVRPGCHVSHNGFIHFDRGQERPPPHSFPLPFQQPGQPRTLCLQPLISQRLCTYQTGSQVHHIQGGISQQSTAPRDQGTG